MRIPHGHSVAFESGQRHEVEVVLTALHDAGLPASDVYYTDTGTESPTPSQTSFALWLVLVPTDVLPSARSVIAPLPVSHTDQPAAADAFRPVRHPLLVLTCLVALALLLVILYART